DHQRHRQPAARQIGGEREVSAVPVVAEVDRDDEQDRHDRGRAKPEVSALLVTELGELPAVHGEDSWSHWAASIASGCAGLAWESAVSSPSSTSEKNRSSSVAVWGVSSRISAPASTSACDSSATAPSSALKAICRFSTWASLMPGCARHTASARPSSVVDSAYVVPAARFRSAISPSYTINPDRTIATRLQTSSTSV